jgi:DNA-binding transcriptional MerR regulator
MPDAHYPIQLAARLTGLSTHVIRIWEQRYHAVEPRRTPGNHRLYSQDDIERLSLLRDVTRSGHHNGQLHEMGAMLVAAMAANLGWQVTSLGASLPALEIAGAARKKRARAGALSLVYPEDDTNLPGELTRLREALPEDTALLVGGQPEPAYRGVLGRLGAILAEDLLQLGPALDRLCQPGRKAER